MVSIYEQSLLALSSSVPSATIASDRLARLTGGQKGIPLSHRGRRRRRMG